MYGMKCKNCSKALFNELWGEYICSVRKRKATDKELKDGCAWYNKGEPGVSKGIEENV